LLFGTYFDRRKFKDFVKIDLYIQDKFILILFSKGYSALASENEIIAMKLDVYFEEVVKKKIFGICIV
jgi:hypothetical protein